MVTKNNDLLNKVGVCVEQEWPRDFDFRTSRAEQQELLGLGEEVTVVKEASDNQGQAEHRVGDDGRYLILHQQGANTLAVNRCCR